MPAAPRSSTTWCGTSATQVARSAGRRWRRLTIATTVGLGLGLVAVVFTIFNAFVFLVDDVHHPYELFAVRRPPLGQRDARDLHARGSIEALVREAGIFTDAFARTPEIDSWIEGRRLEGPLVTGNFFQVLGVGAGAGAHAHAVGRRARRPVDHRAQPRARGPGTLPAIRPCSTAPSR